MATQTPPDVIMINQDDTEIAWEKLRKLHHTDMPRSGNYLRRLAAAASLKGSLAP